jgi:hypothetical protein
MLTLRNIVAALVALALLFYAARLATSLQGVRRRRTRARDAEQALGRTVIAELPTSEDLVLFTEDATRFYYGLTPIDKDSVVAVRVLINGSPIAATLSQRHASATDRQPTTFEDRPEGIARDRWDVAIETLAGMVLVECGAIRERVSQELARTIYDAVRLAVERQG